MKDFVITCSTPCDMDAQYLRKHKLFYVGFYYCINDERFVDDFFTTHSVNEFYTLIKTSSVKTSQPDPEQYEKLWARLIDQGFDILHIELSSGLSGAVNSALIAKSSIEQDYKDSKIYIVDSLTGSCGIGLLIDKICEYKSNCNNIDEVYQYAEDLKKNINVVFLVENLDQLIKGGRLSKITGSIGKVLNIVPILHVTEKGTLESIKKSRGLSNALDNIIDIMKSNICEGEKVFIANSNCSQNALLLEDKIKKSFSDTTIRDTYITNIGALIGSHTGEKCLVAAYVGKGRA